MDLLIAFITGLTAGGLGCLAVQGGLLTSSLAYQLENDLQNSDKTGRGKFRPRVFLPISLFLGAKLVAYTILGILLGAFGSLIEFSPMARAILMAAIGIFMLGNGLRMLNVHPFFRWFVIETPSFVTRFIRRFSKQNTTTFTPVFLGAMTVLLPCGVAQVVMAAALGSGDPFLGGGIMFAFTLGTMPVFVFVAYCASRLGSVIERGFTAITAVLLVALGLFSIVYAGNLAGLPLTLPEWTNSLTSVSPDSDSASLPVAKEAARRDYFVISVSSEGYSPKVLHLPANRTVAVVWETGGATCCAQSVVIPALGYQQVLPGNTSVRMNVPPQNKGTVMDYSCSMGRRTGRLVFDRI